MKEAPSIVNEIHAFLDSEKGNMFTFLKKMVQMESPSADAVAVDTVMRFIQEELKSLGYYTFRHPGKVTAGYLYARPAKRKKKQPVQLLIGHTDTVWPLGTLEEMPVAEKDGTLKGPGIFDMKAGITQILYALRALKELSLTHTVMPVVLINGDEEIGSPESTRIIARLAKIADRAFVLEPPLGRDGKLKTARKGIGRFTIKVEGKSAHAGLDPEKGVSAIMELSHQIQRLYAFNDAEKGISINVGTITGGVSPNVVADSSSAVVDVRVYNNEDADHITKKIHEMEPVHKDVVLYVDGAMGRLPMEKNERNNKLWECAKQAGKSLGIELEEATAGGGSDGNTTSAYTATLDGLGTPGDGAHALHEFIFKDKLRERTALLILLLLAGPLKT